MYKICENWRPLIFLRVSIHFRQVCVQLHSGCNCCSQWLQLTFVVKYATLICKLCKYIHECLHHKTAEANNCNSFKYLLQRLQTKFAALKICNAGCTLVANICSVHKNWAKNVTIFFYIYWIIIFIKVNFVL